MIPASRDHRRGGMALILAMIAISTLGLLGLAVLSAVRIDLRIAANHRDTVDAFYQGEAGVQYVFSQLAADAHTGALRLDAGSVAVDYPAPDGFGFDTVDQVYSFARPDTYRFEVVGRAAQAVSRMEVVFSRLDNSWPYAVFGRNSVTVDDSAVTGYDGCNPTNAAASGGANIVANQALVLTRQATVDGNVDEGEEGGTPAVLTADGDTATTGILGNPVGPVGRDPLGMIGGDLQAYINSIQAANDNAGASPPILLNRLVLNGSQSMHLPAGRYYLTELGIDNFCTLTTGGAVDIVVEGKFTIQRNSQVNAGGNPTDLRFYCTNLAPTAPGTQRIDIHDHVTVNAVIYAPWAEIDLHNYAEVRGWIWGDVAKVRNRSTLWFDTCANSAAFNATLVMESWRQIR